MGQISETMNMLDTAEQFILDAFTTEEIERMRKIYSDYEADKENFKLDIDVPFKDKILNFSASKEDTQANIMDTIKFVAEFKKDREKLEKEVKESMAEITEKIKEYKANQREIMEINLKKKAEEEQDENKKAEMLAISQSYTDSYTFAKLFDELHNPSFIYKLRKRLIRFNRLITDFDYIIDKSSMGHAVNTRLRNAMDIFNNAKLFKMDEAESNIFFIALILSVQNYSDNEKVTTWYAYSLLLNIISLGSISSTSDDFEKEKLNYLVEIMKEIDTLFDIQKEKLNYIAESMKEIDTLFDNQKG